MEVNKLVIYSDLKTWKHAYNKFKADWWDQTLIDEKYAFSYPRKNSVGSHHIFDVDKCLDVNNHIGYYKDSNWLRELHIYKQDYSKNV